MTTPRRARWLLALLLATLPALAHAEPLPGLLDPKVVEEAQAQARGQKSAAQSAVRRHARTLGYTRGEIERALTPTMAYHGTFRVALDDGTEVELPWYRTGFAENRLANTDKPVARDEAGVAERAETNKGGIRLHHGVFPEEVYALALKMDTKLATARDALGPDAMRGAKGGIGAGRVVKVGRRYQARVGDLVDPASPVFDRGELMRRFAASYRRAGGDVGPGLDIQAGDVNTKAPEMRALAEAYGSAAHPSSGVSGKAVRRRPDGSIDPAGGIEYRTISTGDGVWTATRAAARRAGVKLRGASVVAQGWGEVGAAFGHAALRDGARLVAIQEVWNVGGKKVVGTLLQPKGVAAKPREVRAWLAGVEEARRTGADLRTFEGGRLLPHLRAGMDASAVRADIVGVNALGDVLNKKTVPAYARSGTDQGRRKIIVEGANLAETVEGAHLLDRHRAALLAVTGDLANVGGVHVSNLEAVQNVYGHPVSDRVARRSLQGTIRAGWNRAMKLADGRGLSERKAIELSAVDAMMRRSLHRPDAPRARLERRVLPRSMLRPLPGARRR